MISELDVHRLLAGIVVRVGRVRIPRYGLRGIPRPPPGAENPSFDSHTIFDSSAGRPFHDVYRDHVVVESRKDSGISSCLHTYGALVVSCGRGRTTWMVKGSVVAITTKP
jgi:hypothetical protein